MRIFYYAKATSAPYAAVIPNRPIDVHLAFSMRSLKTLLWISAQLE